MCARAYKVQRSLRRHMQIECGKAPKHKCPYCDHCTKYRASILKHIVNIHPEMPVVYGDNGRRANVRAAQWDGASCLWLQKSYEIFSSASKLICYNDETANDSKCDKFRI